MKDQEDLFLKHVALIKRQDYVVSGGQARWMAWCEGPEGYTKRLVNEAKEMMENCNDK